jgi:hypothetical protein
VPVIVERTRIAAVVIARRPEMPLGELHSLKIVHLDAQRQLIGGLTALLQH